MVAKLQAHPGKEAREFQLSIINNNWDLLAVEAYKGFVAHGRGLLAIDESDFLDKPRGVPVKFKMMYMAEGTAEFDKVIGPHEQKWFKEKKYNPAVAMCVTFLRADQGVSSYNVQGLGSRTPKALYERSLKP